MDTEDINTKQGVEKQSMHPDAFYFSTTLIQYNVCSIFPNVK